MLVLIMGIMDFVGKALPFLHCRKPARHFLFICLKTRTCLLCYSSDLIMHVMFIQESLCYPCETSNDHDP